MRKNRNSTQRLAGGIRLAAGMMLVSAVLLPHAVLSQAESGPAALDSAPAEAPPGGEGLSSRPAYFERAAIVTIKDEITDVTRDSIERRLKIVRENGDRLVIFELDTPGGAVGATLEICDLIKQLRDDGIRTYAWVNNQAYSAGTIIALATDGIVMARNATIGDCQPIIVTGTGAGAVPEDIEAKLTSPLLAELRDSARRNGYNLDLVLALVRPEMEIYWLENTKTGERRFVQVHERDELFGLADADPGSSSARDADDKEKPRSSSLTRYVPESRSTTDWKYVQSAPGLPSVPQPIDQADKELLTMRTDEAAAYGFSEATLNDEEELRAYFDVEGPIQRLETTWVENAVAWLASPIVRGVLFLLMLLGAYTEFQHPGFGLPGAVAVVALVLFLGAPYAAGFTVTWEIVVIVLGLLLLAVELFVTPGFGVPGLLGLGLLCVGLLASFVPEEPGFERWPHWPSMPVYFDYMQKGLIAMAGGFTGSLLGMVLVLKYLPRTPVARRLIAANPVRELLAPEDPYEGMAQIGDIGRVEGVLRPAGKARFGALLVDVVSEGEFVSNGMRVEVVGRHGNRVVVRRVD
ncbi:MAG: hypothetical protein AMXMBFR13_50980 [Phycisphaerae bacterium]